MRFVFPEKTLDDFVSVFLSSRIEKNATLCADEDNRIVLGKPVKEGTEYKCPTISKDEMVCPAGTRPVGTIHSHVYEHDERPPFDKGFSNEDVFGFVKEALNKRVDLPYLGCVISPEYKNNNLSGFRVDCEYYKPFTEEDIKKMPNGIVHMKDDRVVREETFSDEQIEWFKKGGVPTGMLGSIGFMVAMANLKMGLKERGFMSSDSFVLPVRGRYINLEEKQLKFDGGE